MTLLSSVQRVYRKLRSDVPSELGETDLLSLTIVDFLNDAASELLNEHKWSFLKYDDGQIFFPGKYTATTGTSVGSGDATISMNPAALNDWGAQQQGIFAGEGLLARFRATNHATQSQTSYPLANLISDITSPGTLRYPFRGATTALTIAPEVYAHEFMLPEACRQVLSVRHQETPINLVFSDRHRDMDFHSPRMTDVFSDRPESVYVGGAVNPTASNILSTDGVIGEGLTIWPPPDSDVLIDYSYIYRPPRLSLASDEWRAVPLEHVSLMENMALFSALESDVANDPKRAALVAGRIDGRLESLLRQDEKAVYKRRIPQEIGRSRHRGSPYRRFSSSTITDPGA